MNLALSSPRRGIFRALALVCLTVGLALSATAAPLKVLFLGHPGGGSHTPSTRLRELAPAMLMRGIQLVYTEDAAQALTLDYLKRYDAFMLYANIDRITPEQEKALLDYVRDGGGFVPVHSASACFGNSDAFIALVGARFKSHGTGTFRTKIVAPDNPVMKGFEGFESWDETYVHDRHNETGRTVLEMRENEPWTWTRTEGKGRVFYTAWGHDQRTWSNPGFHALLERGIRFAAGQALPGALTQQSAGSIAPLVLDELTGGAKVPLYSNEPNTLRNGANPWTHIQRPLAAEQSMQHIIVPGGFELQLFASEPDIKKPIAMNWDERGRLWIIETTDYPNNVLPVNQPGNDRIVICEDTNKDGKADKFTVFADKLNLPTSLTFSQGGIIVLQSPHALFLKDTDGDDKADIKEVLMTGWGRRDTHAVASNLQYGPDNWIWGATGYSGFNGTAGGKPVSFSNAFMRFKPDGSAIESPRAVNNNFWGVGISETGIVFGSTANNVPSVYLAIPARYYEPAGLTASQLPPISDTSRYLPITNKFREVDVFGGYTAGAGHALYTARTYPKEYWNRIAFVNEPTGHLVGQFVLTPDGANFSAKNPTNLLSSDDEWCAPIMSEVGPDGQVWVIDWYNYIIQHNPTPEGYQTGTGAAYENELRDKRHGRIYRVVWKAGKPSEQPNLRNATPAALVSALKNDNFFWRRHAQRLLVERARKDVVPALIDLIKDQSLDEIGLNPGAMHAIWTLQGLNALDSDPTALAATVGALKHPSAGVRRNAVAALPRSLASVNAMADAGVIKDTDGQVRLATFLALAESPDVAVGGKAIHDALLASGLTLDRWMADAAKMAANGQSRSFVEAATPAELAGAKAALAQGSSVLLNSAALAVAGANGLPPGWDVVKTAGDVQVSKANTGRTGPASLQVKISGENASGGASVKVKVKRNFRYELTGWIKTEGLPAAPAGGGRGAGGAPGGGRGGPAAGGGATLAVQQIQGGRGGGGGGRGNAAPTIVRGTSDWTQVRIPVNNPTLEEITVVCSVSLGTTAGAANATAWFEEVALREIGPIDESVADPFNTTLNYVLARTTNTAALVAPAPAGPPATVLNLGVVPDMMKYDKAELTIKAGTPVRLVFKNNDHMQHNVLFLKPGTTNAVGALADAMLNDPRAFARQFVPETSDVIANTPLVNPGETNELTFTAPTTPGRYPFVCTFPGHWRLMQGTLIVTP